MKFGFREMRTPLPTRSRRAVHKKARVASAANPRVDKGSYESDGKAASRQSIINRLTSPAGGDAHGRLLTLDCRRASFCQALRRAGVAPERITVVNYSAAACADIRARAPGVRVVQSCIEDALPELADDEFAVAWLDMENTTIEMPTLLQARRVATTVAVTLCCRGASAETRRQALDAQMQDARMCCNVLMTYQSVGGTSMIFGMFSRSTVPTTLKYLKCELQGSSLVVPLSIFGEDKSQWASKYMLVQGGRALQAKVVGYFGRRVRNWDEAAKGRALLLRFMLANGAFERRIDEWMVGDKEAQQYLLH